MGTAHAPQRWHRPLPPRPPNFPRVDHSEPPGVPGWDLGGTLSLLCSAAPPRVGSPTWVNMGGGWGSAEKHTTVQITSRVCTVGWKGGSRAAPHVVPQCSHGGCRGCSCPRVSLCS